ncbi:hypothetical protein AMQ28_03755 [Acinetobacter sp. TTH0-4]|nr:hypothetical protein AMQ28_03755 [Acinetobacter sp. TTH0-4]
MYGVEGWGIIAYESLSLLRVKVPPLKKGGIRGILKILSLAQQCCSSPGRRGKSRQQKTPQERGFKLNTFIF